MGYIKRIEMTYYFYQDNGIIYTMPAKNKRRAIRKFQMKFGYTLTEKDVLNRTQLKEMQARMKEEEKSCIL